MGLPSAFSASYVYGPFSSSRKVMDWAKPVFKDPFSPSEIFLKSYLNIKNYEYYLKKIRE